MSQEYNRIMKVSAWLTVSDLVPMRKTLLEKAYETVLERDKVALYNSRPIQEIIAGFKQAGINGIELLVPKLTSDENIRDIKIILDKYIMPVFSIHQSLNSFRNISFHEIERLCHIANTFSATVIVLHASALTKKLFDAGFITELKNLQKKYQITFGIENMPKSLFTVKQTVTFDGNEFSRLLSQNGLSITLDVTHLAQAGEDIIQFYLKNKKNIVNIHLSDYKKHWLNRRLLLQSYTHLPLLHGELPVKRFLQTLKQEKYNGLITMEIDTNFEGLCECARIINKNIR
jgi:sugar phosphate isomerase/epimerase